MAHLNLILHVNDDNADKFKLAFSQARNYRTEILYKHYNITPQELTINAAMGNLQDVEPINIVIVVNGPAVRQLVNNNTELMQKAREVHELGVDFYAGGYSMKDHGLSHGEIWDFVKVLPVTVLIAELQQQGYAYIKC